MKRILIIDDSRDLLDVMQIFLDLKGYDVKTLTACNDILDTVKEYNPDLLIVDVFLANEDGREICKKLRDHEATKNLCILLLSGSPAILAEYKKFGANSFIEKPFDINHLLDKIEDVLSLCDERKY
ncbi:MAG: response regulator [Ginsengibacter sp.]